MRYAIYEENMERLTKKMAAIQKKCEKYGCGFTFREVGEEFREVRDEDGNKVTARFVIVEAEGTACVNGWRFIASVEHTDKGNIINRVCDIEVPERYYTAEPVCEHCHTVRNRKDTYIVRNEETGEFKQVGKSCLRDFTHGMSAEMAASYISAFDELIEGEAPCGAGYQAYLNTKEYLRYAAEVVRCFGYVRRDSSRSECTADRAIRYYHHRSARTICEMGDYGIDPDSEEAEKAVEAALAWIAGTEDNDNYMHNLRTVCSLDYNRYKNIGLLASLFPAYDRAMERKEREEKRAQEHQNEAADSRYIGEVGERLNVQIQSAKCLTSWDTMYGRTYLWKIVDLNGNVYTWKTSGGVEDGAKELKGTVKKHTEYNGVKQTELTRCKVTA